MALAKRIIPCLDVDNGRVVKGVNFINIIDAGDPREVAKKYDLEGADELVMLDITASSDIINGTQLLMDLTIQTESGYSRTESFSIRIGNLSVVDPLGPDAMGITFMIQMISIMI